MTKETAERKFIPMDAPEYFKKSDPRCPRCRGLLWYVGRRSSLPGKMQNKVYMCRDCHRLCEEIGASIEK